jgi:hypothetical protein
MSKLRFQYQQYLTHIETNCTSLAVRGVYDPGGPVKDSDASADPSRRSSDRPSAPPASFEGAAKTISFDQLPEAIRSGPEAAHAPDLWVPGPDVRSRAEANGDAGRRFLAAARLDRRYVVAYEHDGWSYHVTLLTYDIGLFRRHAEGRNAATIAGRPARPWPEALNGASQQPGRP